MAKLGKDEVMTIEVLKRKGESVSAMARRLDVTEGAVRYRLKRSGKPDGRKKQGLIEDFKLEKAVARWWANEEKALRH